MEVFTKKKFRNLSFKTSNNNKQKINKRRMPISPELELVGSSKQGPYGPLGQLAGVVLELIGQDGTSLRIQLLAPVDAARGLEEETHGKNRKQIVSQIEI